VRERNTREGAADHERYQAGAREQSDMQPRKVSHAFRRVGALVVAVQRAEARRQLAMLRGVLVSRCDS
jgi:hypothetical protein